MPPRYQPRLFALPQATLSTEPSVRYRGIFINDEAPALTGWVREKFVGYNVHFYTKVFELLLRLKANFLWPAMWPGWPNPGASFFTDDPENQKTADTWGIVMSTSHHEPMQRLSNEWLAENPLGTWDWLTNKEKITKFFAEGVHRAKGYESYFTMGMRGEYDTKMRTEDPASVVKDVLKTQRRLVKDTHGSEDAVPQLLALYKEVQEQYESGQLGVPDDVTLLFSDDNFGTIRRLPYGEERKRSGGAGLYYHLEYVGTPRSYKWINSNSLHKVLHQLQQAHRRHARQIWVFNVGDIKPLEVPLTFAMALAWNINSVQPTEEGIPSFLHDLACHQFGSELGALVGQAWARYDQLVSLRRQEHIEPTTFSLLHYNEAENLASQWEELSMRADMIFSKASEEMKPAIFQLVSHPIKATVTFISLKINLGRNQLYARQRRNSANEYADLVLKLFDDDQTLTECYHSLLGGKWNHILSQPHLGFDDSTWHAPSRDMVSGLCYVQRRQNSNPIVGQLGVAVEGRAGVRPGLINENSDFTHPSRGDLVFGLTLGLMTRYGPQRRWFDLFRRGTSPVKWNINTPCRWLKLSQSSGTLEHGSEDRRITIEIAWEEVADDFEQEVLIDIRSADGYFEQLHLPIAGRRAPPKTSGYIEGDGLICIHVQGHRSTVDKDQSDGVEASAPARIDRIPMSSTSSESLPDVSLATKEPEQRDYIYQLFFFSDASKSGPSSRARLLLYFNMTLDTDPSHPMSYDLSFDRGSSTRHRLLDDDEEKGDPELPSPQGWIQAVQDCVWVKEHDLRPFELGPGPHDLHLSLLHSNMVLEKIVFDFGGLKQSYRGPPPSRYHISSHHGQAASSEDINLMD